MKDLLAKAETLTEALPWIKATWGSTVVVKYGGAAMTDPALRESVAADIVLMKLVGINPVIVHGGGPEITAFMERLGMPVEFFDGLRVTDDAAMEVVKMVLVGKVNKELVSAINRHGRLAVGISGDDANLIKARPVSARLGRVGEVEAIDTTVVTDLIDDGFIPVIATVGYGDDGGSYNINADLVAGELAGGARRREGDLPHRRRRPLRRLRGQGLAHQRAVAAAGRGPHRRRPLASGMIPKVGGVRPRAARRRAAGAHPQRDGAARAAARGLHRRGRRHDDHRRPARCATPGGERHGRPLTRRSRSTPSSTCTRTRASRSCSCAARACASTTTTGASTSTSSRASARSTSGHSHPAVVEAVREQIGRLTHVSNLYYVEHRDELARDLVTLFGVPSRVFFCNSGAEANEGAIKLARRWGPLAAAPSATDIVTAERSFHGRTLATLAATGQPSKQEAFEPLPAGFSHVPLNDIAALEAAVDDRTCAVLLEPVQGEGGVYPCDPGYLEAVRVLCDEREVLLMFDEVQTGLWRCGAAFAWQVYGVKPDVMCLAKSLANGLPIGAVVAVAEVADALAPGDHGSTFGGGPVVCAAARASLRALQDEELGRRAVESGEYLRARLRSFALDTGAVADVRGAGLMNALEFTDPIAADVADAGRAHGLVLNNIGPHILRILPPLMCGRPEIDTLLAVLYEVAT